MQIRFEYQACDRCAARISKGANPVYVACFFESDGVGIHQSALRNAMLLCEECHRSFKEWSCHADKHKSQNLRKDIEEEAARTIDVYCKEKGE